uniref:Wolframin OB-fold domain-containing protein n=1 Tax=Glossina pallidipes TaxID=7398 RepID=A0A1B0AIL9_GLOPL
MPSPVVLNAKTYDPGIEEVIFRVSWPISLLVCGVNPSLNRLQEKCSLHKWNTHEYEIHVEIAPSGLFNWSHEVILRTAHPFGNFTQRLAEGDRIHFYETLVNSRLVDSLS